MSTARPDIKSYEGPEATPDNFAKAYPRMEDIAKGKGKGGVKHDSESQARLDEMHAQMRRNPPQPATILNLHPFPLKVNGGHLFAGIEVPACQPGEPFAYKHIRGYKWDWKIEADEHATVTPIPVFPIELAADFAREFNGDNGEVFGRGVIFYKGDGHPLKVKEVEIYDDRGIAVVQDEVQEVETPEGLREKAIVQVPVKRKLEDLIQEARAARNKRYLSRIQAATHDWNLPNGAGRKNITDLHLSMAAVLVAEGVLREMPAWKVQTKADEGFEQANCPVCAEPQKTGAIVCKGCNYVYDPLKAYELSIIEYGNLAMERMTSDEWAAAERIKEERTLSRARVPAKHGKAKNPGKGDKEE